MPSEEYLDTPLLKLTDIRRAVQNCGTNKMLKAIILLLLSSGQAQAEILKLKGKHLKNIVSDVAIVSMTRGKTNKRYTFFIGKEAQDAIREYKSEIRDEDYVFTQIMSPEKPLYNPLVGAMFSRHAEKLGMKRKYFAPHRFRHYFKTTLTNKVDFRFVEFWMGHKLSGVESSYFLGDGIVDEMLEAYIKIQTHLTVNTEPEILRQQYDELKGKRDRDNAEVSAMKARLDLLENYVHNLEMAEYDIMELEGVKKDAAEKERTQILDTPIKPVPHNPPLVIEYTHIYVLNDIPDFIGFDKKLYSLKSGSKAPIPTDNANDLIKKGLAYLSAPVIDSKPN